MKKILSLFITGLILTSCNTKQKPDGYVINGTAKGLSNGIRAYLQTDSPNGNRVNRDTAIIYNETFKFEGKVSVPELQYLYINSVNANKPLIVENDIINIEVYKDSLFKSVVTGTKSNEVYNLYLEELDLLAKKQNVLKTDLSKAGISRDTDAINQAKKALSEFNNERNRRSYEFVKKHNDNFFVLTILETLIDSKIADTNQIELAFNSITPEFKESIYGNSIKLKIAALKHEQDRFTALNIGKVAPNFSAPDTNGNLVSLDEMKGKVTIIDFWAAWCGPCRRENPNVVKTYKKYHEKGLEIISVSLDKPGEKDRWLKAIKDDNLTWHHVSNLKYFNDPVARLYNIRSIPSTYILDENGKIVAKNLRGTRLEAKIKELLD